LTLIPGTDKASNPWLYPGTQKSNPKKVPSIHCFKGFTASAFFVSNVLGQ
jgi:hypothetical protein